MAGVLYLVATPIGNLEDISYRAVRILKEVDLIACEDTRQTRKLLDHYGIDKPTVSCHEHNEAARAEQLLKRLAEGDRVALVSDSGTPLIADPGYRLLARTLESGIAVIPIPGPSAVISALGAGGLPTDSFCFGGFLPAKAGARRRLLEHRKREPATLVFYEAPHRILDTLEDVRQVLGDRAVVVAREMTKVHEEFLRGTASAVKQELGRRPSVKGEITLLIARSDEEPAASAETIRREVTVLMSQGVPRMEAMKSVARRHGLSKREIYRTLEEDAPG